MAEERREPDYRDGGARKAEALRDQHGHEPFQRVPEERQEARGRAGGAGDVGRADVAAADVARIDAAAAAQQDAGRNRSAEIRDGCERERQH